MGGWWPLETDKGCEKSVDMSSAARDVLSSSHGSAGAHPPWLWCCCTVGGQLKEEWGGRGFSS